MSSNKRQSADTFSEVSADAIKSLTDLLFLTNIDKKLLVSLGEFFFRMMDSTLMSKQSLKDDETEEAAKERRLKDAERSRNNFNLITKQCYDIASKNLVSLSMNIDSVTEVALDLGIDFNKLQMNKTPSKVEGASQQDTKVNLTKEQERLLRSQIKSFGQVSAPLRHVLMLYAHFF